MTEPTRDLVDREELRQRLEAWRDRCRTDDYINAITGTISYLIDAPSAECPRGWTRDEVLHEMDTHPGAKCEWLSFTGKWVEVARRTIEKWHPEVRRYDVRVVLPEPPVTVWVPLTKLVGRTIAGCDKPSDGHPSYDDVFDNWMWRNGASWMVIPSRKLNLETGMVEVLAGGGA